ncbi:hypothetical protein QFZ75_003398 [Streptomyces sp. V3I8]|nr:hypothetical protein [Streptomyces sp. V3I8]
MRCAHRWGAGPKTGSRSSRGRPGGSARARPGAVVRGGVPGACACPRPRPGLLAAAPPGSGPRRQLPHRTPQLFPSGVPAETKIQCVELQRTSRSRARLSREAYDLRALDRDGSGAGARSGRGRKDVPRTFGGPRRRVAPGPVLPCADPEPRAPRVIPFGPSSPSGPPPVGDLPSGAAANPWATSLEGGVLPPRNPFSNTYSIAWGRRDDHGVRGNNQQEQRAGPAERINGGASVWCGAST